MTDRAAPLVTTLSVLAFLGWLAVASDGGRDAIAARTDPLDGRSDAPLREPVSACALPVGWYVADVDPRFGAPRDSVSTAVLKATEMWEEGAGRELFAERRDGEGIPVRLIYDHRQARTDERVREEGLVRRQDESLALETADLARAWEEQHDARASYLAEHAELAEAVIEHNVAVRGWNERGGAPERVAVELTGEGERLRRVEERLAVAARRLQREEDALRDAELELTERITARNAEAGRLARTYGRVAVESGAYLGSAGGGPPGREGAYREIRVFRFQGGDELVGVLAHELGHAMGLGHVDEEGALMHGLHGRSRSEGGPRPLHSADVAALEARCGWSTSR